MMIATVLASLKEMHLLDDFSNLTRERAPVGEHGSMEGEGVRGHDTAGGQGA